MTQGKLNVVDVAHPSEKSGVVVLGMGKLGAFELNYSSDIDLVVFYEPQAPLITIRTMRRRRLPGCCAG
jgi:glutamate-ammonia-ligase adenylyltransferase